jgi:hypothetical protein
LVQKDDLDPIMLPKPWDRSETPWACDPCRHHLLKLIQNGDLDPTMVITHELPLEDAPRGYKIFNDKEDGCIKVLLKPGLTEARPGPGAIKSAA